MNDLEFVSAYIKDNYSEMDESEELTDKLRHSKTTQVAQIKTMPNFAKSYNVLDKSRSNKSGLMPRPPGTSSS